MLQNSSLKSKINIYEKYHTQFTKSTLVSLLYQRSYTKRWVQGKRSPQMLHSLTHSTGSCQGHPCVRYYFKEKNNQEPKDLVLVLELEFNQRLYTENKIIASRNAVNFRILKESKKGKINRSELKRMDDILRHLRRPKQSSLTEYRIEGENL